MTDPQLAMIVKLSNRPGTPPEVRELLENSLIEKASKDWGIEFIGKLIAADWDFVKEAVEELEEDCREERARKRVERWERKKNSAVTNAEAH